MFSTASLTVVRDDRHLLDPNVFTHAASLVDALGAKDAVSYVHVLREVVDLTRGERVDEIHWRCDWPWVLQTAFDRVELEVTYIAHGVDLVADRTDVGSDVARGCVITMFSLLVLDVVHMSTHRWWYAAIVVHDFGIWVPSIAHSLAFEGRPQ